MRWNLHQLALNIVRKAFKASVPAPQAAPSKFDTLGGPGMRTPATGRVLQQESAQVVRSEDVPMDGLKI